MVKPSGLVQFSCLELLLQYLVPHRDYNLLYHLDRLPMASSWNLRRRNTLPLGSKQFLVEACSHSLSTRFTSSCSRCALARVNGPLQTRCLVHYVGCLVHHLWCPHQLWSWTKTSFDEDRRTEIWWRPLRRRETSMKTYSTKASWIFDEDHFDEDNFDDDNCDEEHFKLRWRSFHRRQLWRRQFCQKKFWRRLFCQRQLRWRQFCRREFLTKTILSRRISDEIHFVEDNFDEDNFVGENF